MPQSDLETLVTSFSGGATDRKIACETLAADENPHKDNSDDNSTELPPDFPPESFWLSKDAEYDWFDRNAFLDRKDSTKGTTTINNSNSTSQRFSVSLKSKPSIIGLPKSQKTTFADSKRRPCKPPANIRLFPKRSQSVGKTLAATPSLAEPGSPKVSCMGRVRSKRCRRRSNSLKRSEKPVEKARTGKEKERTGLYSRVMSIFRSKKGQKKPGRSGSRKMVEVLVEEPVVVVEPLRKSVSVKVREVTAGGEAVAEPPGLGGMTRFASGRRSGSWASDDFNQAVFAAA